MKVLLVTFSDNADHQEVIYSLFEELVKKENEVYAMGIKAPKVPYMKHENIKFVNAPKRPGITKGTFNIVELAKILSYIRKEKFDIIYFETLHVWNIPIWIFSPKKTRVIQAIHDVDPHGGDGSVKTVEMMNKAAVKNAEFILLRNADFLPLLKKKYNVADERVFALDPWRRFPEYIKEQHSHRVLFFGRINEYKGVEYIPEIAEICSNIQFDIVGRVDPLVEKTVEELKGFSNLNVVTEYVTDEQMREFFLNADVVILPYKSATQSGVVLDANKFSRPVIAFEVGAIGDQIVSGVNGILVEARDVKTFAENIKELIFAEDEVLDEFSKKAYNYAFERFSSKSAADRFIRIAKEIMKK